jgi:hypothetical protein
LTIARSWTYGKVRDILLFSKSVLVSFENRRKGMPSNGLLIVIILLLVFSTFVNKLKLDKNFARRFFYKLQQKEKEILEKQEIHDKECGELKRMLKTGATFDEMSAEAQEVLEKRKKRKANKK